MKTAYNMKRYFFVVMAALAVLTLSCTRNAETTLRTGDLVFVSIPSDYDLNADSMSGAIGASTAQGSSQMKIHVAILEVQGDSIWIIDATIKHGVDRYPLDTFLTDFTLKDGSLPVFEVLRPNVEAAQAAAFVENAKSYIGQPYDLHFRPDNGAMYCSELVYNAYVTATGEHLFAEVPMNWKDANGEIPLYWQELFAMLGEEVPQGVPGTNPQEMALEPCLKKLACPLCQACPPVTSADSWQCRK